jgi:hypothetical protein
MTRFQTAIVLVVAAVSLVFMSRGSAQQDSMGDTGLSVRQDDLDSFWLDTHNWYWYGYRPYTKAHISRFAPSLPTWSSAAAANTGGYSFGMNEPAGNASWEGGPTTKFQLDKNGTWH